MAEDFYEILQVHPRADRSSIEAAYQRLRDRYDPARLDGAADELVELARAKRDAIERAYAVLADPERRATYDAALHTGNGAASPRATPAPGQRPPPSHGHPGGKELALDYRPLPAAMRAERPRDFDAAPTRSLAGRPVASSPRWRAAVAAVALLALVIGVSLALTGGSGPAAAPVAPNRVGVDQFEALILEKQRAAEQRPTDAQAWIEYGDVLYDSVQVVREQAPDSELYQQRLPRWLLATTAYSRALELDPANPSVRADLGASSCFYGAGTGDQSFVRHGLSQTRQATQEAPTNPRALLSLGYCLVNSRPPQTEEALVSWRRVIQIAPPDSPLAIQARQLIAQYGE